MQVSVPCSYDLRPTSRCSRFMWLVSMYFDLKKTEHTSHWWSTAGMMPCLANRCRFSISRVKEHEFTPHMVHPLFATKASLIFFPSGGHVCNVCWNSILYWTDRDRRRIGTQQSKRYDHNPLKHCRGTLCWRRRFDDAKRARQPHSFPGICRILYSLFGHQLQRSDHERECLHMVDTQATQAAETAHSIKLRRWH